MPGGSLPDPFDFVRRAAAIPGGYQESGISGAMQAFENPAPFENQARDAKFQQAYAPTLATINQHIQEGDPEKAIIGIVSLRQQMQDNNARQSDIDRFTGGYLKLAAQSGLAQKSVSTPGGQDFAMNVAATANPAAAPQLAEAAVSMPNKRLAADLTQANVGKANAATAESQAQATQQIPAASRLYNAEAGYYEQGGPALGRVGSDRTARDMISGANLLQKYETGISKALNDPMNPASRNPNAINGQLDMRNQMARSLGQPELELTTIVDPNANAALPLSQRQTYALRMKQEPQAAAPQAANAGFHIGPGAMPPPAAPPPNLPQADANAGLPGARPRPNFQAAVQNPLGALPPQIQQQLQDPKQIVSAKVAVQSYIDQGFTPEESNQLIDALMAQITGGSQAPAAPPQPARNPFQPSAAAAGQ